MQLLSKVGNRVSCCLSTLLIGLFLLMSSAALAQPAETNKSPAAIRDTGKPGDYRLVASHDDKVCQGFTRLFARSRSKSGDLDFSKRAEAANWRQPVEGVVLTPPMQVAEIDIDNDGNIDRVFRVHWSVANSQTDDLFVQRLPASREPLPRDAAAVEQVWRSSQRIDFGRGDGPAIADLKSRYGADWEKWLILGQVFADVLRVNQRNYLVVWEYDAPVSALARAHVLQATHDGRSQGVCVFGRICPCTGCTPQHNQLGDLSPAGLYCKKP